jgi:hypothetical protein
MLKTIVKEIHSAQNRVGRTMNGVVLAVGSFVKPLLKRAKAGQGIRSAHWRCFREHGRHSL